MKTEYQINMDFQKAEAQVATLRQLATQLSSVANDDLNGTLVGISASWEGENADAFIQKGMLLKQKICGTAEDITRVADSLHSIAENIKAAELEAIRIAREKGAISSHFPFHDGIAGKAIEGITDGKPVAVPIGGIPIDLSESNNGGGGFR